MNGNCAKPLFNKDATKKCLLNNRSLSKVGKKEAIKMIISANIKKYREKNGLTQSALSSMMNISRQSISKWETGQALPSIDNLIMLSDLLDIPLDQLVREAEQLSTPFYYGKPKNKVPLYAWLFLPAILCISGVLSKSYIEIVVAAFLTFLFYSLGFYDFKKYYTYFIITKRGFLVSDAKPWFPFLPFISIIRGAFNQRKEKEILFSAVSFGSIYFENKGFEGPNTSVIYRPRQFYVTRESFYLQLFLLNHQKVELNLDQAFYPESNERKNFINIFKFLMKKGVRIKDPYNILKSLEKELNFIDEAYKLRKEKMSEKAPTESEI